MKANLKTITVVVAGALLAMQAVPASAEEYLAPVAMFMDAKSDLTAAQTAKTAADAAVNTAATKVTADSTALTTAQTAATTAANTLTAAQTKLNTDNATYNAAVTAKAQADAKIVALASQLTTDKAAQTAALAAKTAADKTVTTLSAQKPVDNQRLTAAKTAATAANNAVTAASNKVIATTTDQKNAAVAAANAAALITSVNKLITPDNTAVAAATASKKTADAAVTAAQAKLDADKLAQSNAVAAQTAAAAKLVAAQAAVNPAPVVTPPATTTVAKVDYVAAEKANSWAINAVKGDWAYANGFTGKGVAVADLDGGVYTTNAQLVGRLLPGYNAIDKNTTITEKLPHGTQTAGLIVAAHDGATAKNTADMYGMAPEAKLVPVIVGDGNGVPWAAVAKGIDWVVAQPSATNIRVLNMSFGWAAPGSGSSNGDAAVVTSLKAAVTAGKLMVVAAGNDGKANPEFPAQYANQTWSNGQIVAVGAVDRYNQIASYSNRAGNTMYNYIVAPGTMVSSTSGTGYASGLMGTSFATPIVSGGAALIMAAWPKVTAAQTASIMFVTATDLGAPGVDTTYGWGLLNVQAALQPVAYTNVQTANGSVSTQHLGTVIVDPGTGAAIKMAGLSSIKTVALDAFGRDFEVDVSKSVQVAPRQQSALSVGQVFSSMESRMKMVETQVGGMRLVASYSEPVKQYETLGMNLDDRQLEALKANRMASMYMSGPLGAGRVTIGSGSTGEMFFGLGETLPVQSTFASSKALSNPFLGMVKGYSHIGFAAPVSSGLELKVGVLSSSANVANYGFVDNLVASNSMGFFSSGKFGAQYDPSMQPRNQALVSELSYRGQEYQVTASWGQVTEQHSLMGNVSYGDGFSLPNAATQFVSFAGTYQVAPTTYLAGMLSIGNTKGFSNGSSLISAGTNTPSNAWSIGLISSEVLTKGDRMGFAVGQAMKRTGGTMTVSTLHRVDDQGNLGWTNTAVSLAQTGTERNVEFNYTTPVGKTANLSLVAANRYQPGNDAAAPTDRVVGARWTMQF